VEPFTRQLLAKYFTIRRDLAKLFCALSALPMDSKPSPSSNWQTVVTLEELQAGDPAIADGITQWVAALENDAAAAFAHNSAPSQQPKVA
jgi:hypothetical protein